MTHPSFVTALACLPLMGCALFGSSTDAVTLAGWEQLEQGNYAGALEHFDRALESSDRAENHAGRARAHFLLGQLDQARRAYAEAISRDPDQAQWQVGLALVELECGEVQAAIGACDAAIEIAPRLAKAYYNRACAHLQGGGYEAALADFTHTLRLAPQFAQAYNGRGVVLARIGRRHAALEDFRQATRNSPMADAHGNAAAVHYAQGDAPQALAELNAAVRIDRSQPVHYANRGRIYLDLGQAQLAALEFEQALALDPGAQEISRLLAQALEQQGSQALQEDSHVQPAVHALPAGN